MSVEPVSATVVDTSNASKAEEAFIEVRDLVAGYNGLVVVEGFSMNVTRGQHVSLLGPSGCGKTTTLRCVAGLERPMSGTIIIGGKVIFSSETGVNVPPERRGLSMVFQSYAIWPHMTVFDNVAYGLRNRGVRGSALRDQVMAALRMVAIEEYADKRATALSGGQQQRVALARSYAFNPSVLLMDEPLSNLDARLRVHMREELKDLQQRLGLTTLYVTHDQEEAMSLSDRVLVMNSGRIDQEGEPQDIFDRPRTRFTADFIGAANVYEGELTKSDDGWSFDVGDTRVTCSAPTDATSDEVVLSDFPLLAVRPVYVDLRAGTTADTENEWMATIVRRSTMGAFIDYTLTWSAGTINVRTGPMILFEVGESVVLAIPAARAIPVRVG